MKDEEKKVAAPPMRKPMLSSDRPKTAAATSTKAPLAPVIVEEDLGTGLSKEDAIAKV
jgi:hypothetical protein